MEDIKVEFLDGGVPATGLVPTITIRLADGSIVVNAENMTEVADGWYVYSFSGYNKSLQYFFRADGGPSLSDSDRYIGNVNFLDAYPNKNDRKGGGSTIVGFPQEQRKELAESIWDEMTKDHKKSGSFGELVQTLEKEDKDKEGKEKEKMKMREGMHMELIEEIKKGNKDVKADNAKNTIKVLNSLEILEKKEYTGEKIDYDLIISKISTKIKELSDLVVERTEKEEEEEEEIEDDTEEKNEELIKNISELLDNMKDTLKEAIYSTDKKNRLDGIDKQLYYLTDTINTLNPNMFAG